MMLFTFALSALTPAAVLATYTVHQVNVGANGKLAYEPDYVNAHPGDVVRFDFFPKNHTVTQSSFENPCVPLADGLNSGFVPVAPDAIGKVEPYFVLVKDYSPLWFYCQQPNPAPGHCVNGMVFAINPPPALLANYRASARVVAAREVENDVGSFPRSEGTGENIAPPWRVGTGENVAPPWRVGTGENVAPPWREGTAENVAPPWRVGTGENVAPPWREGTAENAAPPWREGTAENVAPPRSDGTGENIAPPWRVGTGENVAPPWREGTAENVAPPWRVGTGEDTHNAAPPWRKTPTGASALA